MSVVDRLILLAMCMVAGYYIISGVEGLAPIPMTAYTVGSGVLLVAGLLLIILGFEVLDSPVVVIVSTLIPLSFSLGLVWQHVALLRNFYLVFTLVGFIAIILTRLMPSQSRLSTVVVATVHGIAGMIIFLLPILLSLQGTMKPLFSLVGAGGALIGLAGILLSFLKTGKPILSREGILKVLPALLLFMTLFFVAGFHLG